MQKSLVLSNSKRRVGKTLRGSSAIAKTVKLHLVVTRRSGDTERHLLGEVPDLVAAMAYRRSLAKVKLPKRFIRKWVA